MLEFQITQWPFRFGLAEGTDPRQVPPGTLTTAENCVWRQSGRLEKRYGTLALTKSVSNASNITTATRLFTRGSELCLTDGTSLYSYADSRTTWRSTGAVAEAIPTWSTVLDTMQGVASVDVTYASGVLFYAWTTGDPWAANTATDLWFQAVDATNGQVVYGPSRIQTGPTFGVRVMYDDVHSKIIILTRTGAAAPYTLTFFSFDLATYTFLLPSTALKADVGINNGTAAWDAHLYSGTLAVGYNRTGSIIALETFTPTALGAFTAVASGTVVDASGCTTISIHGTSGESLYVVYVQGTAVPRVFRMAVNIPSTLAAVTAATTIDTPAAGGAGISVGVARYTSAQCVCSVSTLDGTTLLRLNTYIRTNAGASVLTVDTYHAAIATARPFMMGSKAYITAVLLTAGVGASGTNSCLLVADENRHLGVIDLLVGGFPQVGAPISSTAALSSSVTVGALPFQSAASLDLTNWRQGVRALRVSTGTSKPTDTYRGASSGLEAFCCGGLLTSYDGSSTFDYGFASTPVLSISTSAVGGAIAAGTYLYSAVTEFRSRTGLLYRSPPAITKTQVTAGATSTNTVIVLNCNLSNKPNIIGFVTEGVYRSTVGGAVPQRLSFEPTYNAVYTDRSTAGQTLSDTRLDANIGAVVSLATRPALYTTGGILDDYQPPAGVTMFPHVDRLFVLAGDQLTWWFSKAFQDDLGTAPGFHPTNRITFAETQTAGGSMDDKAVFYSAKGIAYMPGLGPAPNGQNSDFGTPIKVQTDVGCTNARSLVSMPDGHMFLSDRGIYLLTRGLELVWIGKPVKDTLALFPAITSAVLVAKRNQVRFTCNDSATSPTAGCTLVYDYVEKQWTTFRHAQGTSGAAGLTYADACIWNGEWTFVTPAGQVYVESSSTYLDGSTWVPMTLETAWMSASGPLAFQSVREFNIHGQSYTDHDLTVSVGFDSDTSYPQVASFLAGSAVTTVGAEECSVTIGTRRKCQTIRFKIADATPTSGTIGTGRGPAFDMMGIQVGVKRGFGNTPATRKG